MTNIIHRVGMKAPIAKVYEAVATAAGVASWWTKDTRGSATIGGMMEMIFFSPEGIEKGRMEMEVLTLETNKKVQWRCKAGPQEWIGTDITFDLKEEGDYTVLIFGHRNWKEAVEFTAHCSMKWATFLMSLKELIETGKGKPSPVDTKIDNWN